jgi:hypothetical protein
MWQTSHLLTRGDAESDNRPGGKAVPANAASEETPDDDPAASAGVHRAALAFSAMPTGAALSIASRLTLVERNRLREGLARVRDVSDLERRDAVSELVKAVHEGVGFPAPARHDEDRCPFRKIESTPTEELTSVLASCARTQPLLVATALCHLGPGYRSEIWSALDSEDRDAVRPTLGQISTMSATRTAMYALDLRDRIAHRR